MDFQLQADQLLLPEQDFTPPLYLEETVIAAGVRYRVRFRLPCAADFEQTLSKAGRTASELVRVVLARSVEWMRLEDDASATIPLELWPEEVAERICERMGELDPQAEIALQLQCPACQHRFSSTLDIGEYFCRELAAREDCRYREVHQLALAYHWSEADILGMSPRKRLHYLDLLAESSGG